MGVTFRSRVEQAEGLNATGIPVPDDVVSALGDRKNPQVKVTVPGYSYRTTVATRGGRFMLALSAGHRAAAGLSAGDEVEVTLEIDDQPRTVEVPDDLADALRDAGLSDRFDALSYSKQRAQVDPLTAAKTLETRQRRLAKIVADLRT